MSECRCGEEGEPGARSEQSAAVAQEKQVWREGQPHRMAVHSPRQTPHPDSKATRNEMGGGVCGTTLSGIQEEPGTSPGCA